ncbi:MAG TPA: AAA family ATPase [Ramlibacter sp.]|nr:AAA family ATPase [Ramlibacter sp.]
MKIKTIRVEGFKRFRDAFTLDQLSEGVNLIAAPNGSGKSTLAEAVRVGFQERHRTASLGEMLAPWTQPGASPSVQIEFLHDGKQYRVAKTFGGKKSCTLDIEGRAVTGEDAEQALAEMFSFSYAGKGVSKPEHQGVPGLLWVRQGAAGEIGTPVASAHEYIRRALGDDMGELAATAGDRVIERVEGELGGLLTRGGKPTGEYARQLEQLAAKQDELTAIETNIVEYETAVDRFGSLQARHAEGARDKPWERQREEAKSLEEQLQALAAIERQRAERDLERQVAEGRVVQCTEQLGAFDLDDKSVQERAEELQAAQARDGQTLEQVRSAEAALKSAQEADAAAREKAVLARHAAARQSHLDQQKAANARRTQLERQISGIAEHQAELARHQAEPARLAAFAGAGKKLQTAEATLVTARARLEAVSTRLEYDLRNGGVRLGGAMLVGAGTRTLSEPAEIEIDGVGTIRVLPGAQDLSELQAECNRAQRVLSNALQAMGVTSVEDARRGEDDLRAAQAKVKQLEVLVAGLAPEGVDALRAEARKAEGDEKRHAEALSALPPGVDPGISVAAAEAEEQVTQKSLRDAQAAHERAREEAGGAQAQLRIAKRELEAAQARISAPGREDRRRLVQRELLAARAECEEKLEGVRQLDEQLKAARPDQLRLDIQRLAKSASALEAAHSTVGAELTHLAGQLQAKGALGLQEDAASLRDKIARLERQVAERSGRAAALTHLLAVLTEKRAEVARGIRAPLQLHMNHYLGIQFPGMRIDLDDALRPARITRSGQHGAETGSFEELSGGEREQLGIIARLAYADLLKNAGKPTLIMLDDSLVNSDLVRLAGMKRVLYDAAQRHQILIFTCHQENWLDMGVAPRTLQ